MQKSIKRKMHKMQQNKKRNKTETGTLSAYFSKVIFTFYKPMISAECTIC